MKKSVLFFLLMLPATALFANHLKGGWILYEYLGEGSSASFSTYRITVNQYLDCHSTDAQIDDEVYLGIFTGNTSQLLNTVTIPFTSTTEEEKQFFGCISPAPEVCYRVDKYVTVLELPNNTQGYTLSVQRCCRIANIVNVANSNTVGITYTNTIPGIINGIAYRNNNSPVFAQKDTAVVCHNTFFTFDFSAVDIDGNDLVYSFVPGLIGGDQSTAGTHPNPPVMPSPPFNQNAEVIYKNGFSGNAPMGSAVTINSTTGIISGIAPNATGDYVVAVAVDEYKDGVLIGTTRKELHINVANCQLDAATLKPSYIACDSFKVDFKNETSTSPGSLYFWDFGEPSSGPNNTSNLIAPSHIYADTGIYKLKLRVVSSGGCSDSATALVKVYPGFFPGFTYTGQCKLTPIQFKDISTTKYGFIDSWTWDFGDPSTNADVSSVKNPAYTYSTAGTFTTKLTVTSNKGCTGTFPLDVLIKDKPDLTKTNDTLICEPVDTLQLNALGNGTIFWTPNYNISDQNSASPLVSPKVPTVYYVQLTDPYGCINRDSVFVDVTDHVDITTISDTTICKTDTIPLTTISNGLKFKWTPATYLNSDVAKSPLATPLIPTKYVVTGTVGKCSTKDTVTITPVPYPAAKASPDTSICFGNPAQLYASGGSIYNWTPAFFLNNPNIPNPVATPDKTIRYIVSVKDVLGCPKPVYDTVIVTVFKVVGDAGPRDTSVVVNQPLQLHATGGTVYLWTPATGLNNNSIADPVAHITSSIQYVVKVSNDIGCFARDTINVKVYNVIPSLYLPNAFTPDGDGKNDIFRPIAIGIKQINYFKVYNRWGQLVYATTQINKGWDGNFKGKPQDAAAYVWMVEGVDYLGNTITKKGSMVLIR